MAEQTSDGAAAPTEATRTPRRRDLPGEGQLLLLITLGLTAIGQVMVYSASSPVAMTTARYGNDPLYFVKNGVVFTIAGVLLMLLVMRMPVSLFKSLTPLALVVSLVLLVAVMVPGVGATINGARRWIAVGPITLQPSELAKLALLGTVAALLAAKKTAPQTFGELMKPIGLLTGLVCALVLAEPDLGLGDRDRADGRRDADRRRRAGAAVRRDHGHRASPSAGSRSGSSRTAASACSRSSTRRRTPAAAPTRCCRASSASPPAAPAASAWASRSRRSTTCPRRTPT